MTRSIRFGHQARPAADDDLGDLARRAEAVGFDVFLLSDHVGTGVAPMVALAAVAATTTTIRLGTFVLNSEMRNPVQLAWEASTLDHLSGGRFELGVGAGHTPQEWAATGIAHHGASERKRALAERVEILRRLLDGDTLTIDGTAHRLVDANVPRARQVRLPILVGGNGAALLAHAGAHADIIGLQGLGRTLENGHEHSVRWTTTHLERQLEAVRTGAGDRVAEIEFNALVQVVEITDDAERSLDTVAEMLGEGVSRPDLVDLPYVLIGTVDEVAAKIIRCRNRWGITYFAVRACDEFAPVIRRVREMEGVR